MAKAKLTKRTVEGLAVKEANYIVFDADLPGFGVRVMPSGKRFFLIQYRRHCRTRRVMLGQFGPITAEMARKDALQMLGNVRGGGADPAAHRDLERQSMTVKALGERFLREHVAVRCKPSTQAEYKRSVELFINPFFGKQRARSVTSADVADLHGSYAHIPYQANRTLGVLSKMMSLAETWGIRDKHSNPCEDIARYPEHKRERFLSTKEMQRLGAILMQSEMDGTESPYAAAAYRLLLLTGCRLSEIQKLEWRYVDLDAAQLNLPDSKTGAKVVHLGVAAVEAFRKIRRVKDNPYVIVGKIKGGYLTDLQKPWRRIRKAAGLDGMRIHDLRHTFASGGLLVGESLPIIGKLLGHTQVQTTARYAHLAADPAKAAATRISEQLAVALGTMDSAPVATPPDGVVIESTQPAIDGAPVNGLTSSDGEVIALRGDMPPSTPPTTVAPDHPVPMIDTRPWLTWKGPISASGWLSPMFTLSGPAFPHILRHSASTVEETI